MTLLWAVLLQIVLNTLALGAPPTPTPGATPASSPASAPAALTPASDASEFRTADDLLRALESADRDILTFEADLLYDRFFELQGDRHIRTGKLLFDVQRLMRVGPGAADQPPPPPRRTFVVDLDTLRIEGVERDDRQQWIFDGQWLIERREKEKQWTAREIARPGQDVDPLRLGEGPLPIPIGQRRDDIVARYEAALLPALEGLDPADPERALYAQAAKGSWQLRLTPRGRSGAGAADEFGEIRLWYVRLPAAADGSPGPLVPRLSRTKSRSGDESLVLLTNARVNAPGFPRDRLTAMQQRPDPAAGWQVQEERGRFQQDDGADAPPAAGEATPKPGVPPTSGSQPADSSKGTSKGG
ncbi:MAG: hypothetical protein IBJ11_06380 [Phycisphaerales bacterium]|nr:hypothetical protein [Phycisphaerales bacterium]